MMWGKNSTTKIQWFTAGLLGLFLSGCSLRTASVTTTAPPPVRSVVVTPDLEPAAPPAIEEVAAVGWLPARGLSDRWTDIVIHHSATSVGGAERIDAYHRSPRTEGGCGWDELGYHFVIGNGTDTGAGQVEVGPRWRKQKHGSHCKTPDNWYDDHGIGICLVGNFDHTPPKAAQMSALAKLVRFLMEECDIPLSNIRTHCGVTHETRCPGSMFSLTELQRYLREPVLAAKQ